MSPTPPYLQELDARLQNCGLDKGTEHDGEALLEALREHGDHDYIRSVITSICASNERLAQCAQASVAHPLGFDKFTLIGSPVYELKLHIWWPGMSVRPVEDVHNHRFSFASTVIAGSLQTEVFQLASTGVPVLRYTESKDASQDRYGFVEQGLTHLSLTQRYVVGPRSTYSMTSDVLHRVSAPAPGLTATLFLKLPSTRRETTVLVDPAQPKQPYRNRDTFSTDDIHGKFQEFLRLL